MQNPFATGYYGSEELRSFGFARVGENVQIAKNCTIVGLENIEIGDNVRVDGFCSLIATGPLLIGNYVHIHSYCQIGSRGGVTFEDYTSLASGCLVYSASDDVLGRHMVGGVVPEHCTKPKTAPVRFGKHSGMFAACTILPGVTLEEGAIVCAHSLVTRDVPEWTVAGGAPAAERTKRHRRVTALAAGIVEGCDATAYRHDANTRIASATKVGAPAYSNVAKTCDGSDVLKFVATTSMRSSVIPGVAFTRARMVCGEMPDTLS